MSSFIRFRDVLINRNKLAWISIILEKDVFCIFFRFDLPALDFALPYNTRLEAERDLTYLQSLIN